MSKMSRKKAKGGKVEKFNPPVPESKEAESTKEGFKSGGAKHVGHADMKKGHKRMDKKPRKLAAGGSPFSAAKSLSKYASGGDGAGHQNSGPKGEDKENT